ncbi:MAG: response regulator [bacterium]|nr:response regulator [bacterium]
MNHTVLIIEDSDEIRENMKEILQLSNYGVHCASNGKEGLEIAQKKDIDIVLCDVMMPELDGYGVLRGLSNNPKTKNIPFIFVTAKSEKQDLRKGMDMGADDYLTKPFSGNELLSLISARLRKAGEMKERVEKGPNELNNFFGDPTSITDLYKISDKVVPKKLRKKDVLYSEGDFGKHIYFVVSGKIKAFRTNDQGKEYITQVYREKEFLGYSSLNDSSVYEETAEAIEDSEVASVLKRDFQTLLSSNDELHAKFIKFLTSDLSESNDKSIKLAYNSARKRVAEAIVFVAKKYFDVLNDNVIFPISREDISAISGVSPESVSRNLTDLRTERLIEHHNGQIKILNVKKLEGIKN